MDLTCPECRHVVEIEDDQPQRCPNCGATVKLPAVAQVDQTERVVYASVDVEVNKTSTSPGQDAPPTEGSYDYVLPASPVVRPVSVASLVCGLLMCIPIAPQVLAVGFGVFALFRKRRPNERVAAAIAGLILGLVVLTGWLTVFAYAPSFSPAVWVGGMGRRPYQESRSPEWTKARQWATAIQRVHSACLAYHRDFKRWPGSIDDLTGHSLPKSFTLPAGLTYRPVPEDWAASMDWILVVSEDTMCNPAGEKLATPHRVILRISGTTKTLPTNEVERILAEQTPDDALAP